MFAGLAIWVISKNKDKFRFNKKDLAQIIVILLIFLLIGIHIFTQSIDTVKTVLNTVYPGQRTDTGRGSIKYII